MLDLFDPLYRRVRDEREIRYYYTKYGEEAPDVLSDRASDDRLTARDRRHWRRLARKARRRRGELMSMMKTSQTIRRSPYRGRV